MPRDGYSKLFERMLRHPNIKVSAEHRLPGDRVGHSVCGDDLHGADRRVLRLQVREAALPLAGVSVRNIRPPGVSTCRRRELPKRERYTRCTEFKYLTGQEHPRTTRRLRVSNGHRRSRTIPLPRPENAAIYRQYQALAERSEGVHFCGRLASYRYYNMDQVVAQALTLSARLLRGENSLAAQSA